MKLEYSLTFDDFLKHRLYEASKSKLINKKRRQQRLIIPILYLVIGLVSLLISNNLIFAIICFLIAIIWFLFYPIRSKKLHIKHYKKHIEDSCKNKINEHITLEFNDDHIYSKDRISEGKLNLSETNTLIELENHFFLKLQTGDSLIIPKRAVYSSDDFKEMMKQINIPIIDETNWVFK